MISRTISKLYRVAAVLIALPAVVFARSLPPSPPSPPYDVCPPANAPYYRVRYEAKAQPGELIYPVNYTIWIPSGVESLRGVIVHQHGCGEGSCKSGLTGAFDLHWQALGKKHDCALLAPSYEQPDKADCQMWCDPRNGSSAAFQKCLADLGEKSGHPELASVPCALWGHSGGGHWAGGMVLLHPERVVAAWLRSGVPLLKPNPERVTIKAHTLPDEALTVPVMCNPGTQEGVTVKDGRFAGVWPANEAFFSEVRSRGGLISVAVDPLTAHECGNQRYFAIPWLDACLSARLPKSSGDPLMPMPIDGTWLAPISGFNAVPAAAYSDDPLKAAWLPNETIAKAWMQYVQDTALPDATPPPAPTNLRVSGNQLSWNAEADLESGLAGFIIERDGQFLANVPEQGKNPFGRPIFQNLQYSDTPTQPLVPMRFSDTKTEPGTKHSYRVLAVNTVGAKSQPAIASAAQTDSRPNILFFYTDDQAPWGFGASGNPQAHTPNLDRLASEGARLRNSFVTTPVCSPARASLMTSRYASEYGILDFIPDPKHKLYDPDKPIGLDPGSVTFAEILQESGYRTGLIGKWHLGDWTASGHRDYHPTNHGFKYFTGLTGGGSTPDNPLLEKEGTVRRFNGLTTDILTDDAISFINEDHSKPFLLCLNYRAPHGRWLPVAEEDWAPYADMVPVLPQPDYPDLDVELMKQKMREYLASISGVDRNVGRLLQALADSKLDASTVVIFTSDHGYNMGHNGIHHKGNGVWATKTLPEPTSNIASKYRPNLYDNSLKVPAIVRWPGVVKPGTVIDDSTTSLDWYPTLVRIAGAQLSPQHPVRGRSLLPLLRGTTPADWDQDVYAEYSMINYCRAFMRTYRTPQWKLVRDFLNPERDELYHLAVDPEERVNLIHENRTEVRAMVRRLDQEIRRNMRTIDDSLLKKLPTESADDSP